jgi:uncharacterized protein (DUF58 family)
MKKIFTIALMLFAGVMAFAQEKQAEIKFEVTSHDFSNVSEGVQATYEFVFKNVGNVPLVLSSVNPSCGCTIPEWPKDPIGPGQSEKIKAIYNSSGRPGTFSKSITVNSNAKTATVILTIKGNVIPKATEPPSPVVNPTK